MRKISRVLPSAVQNDEALRAAKAQMILRRVWKDVVGEQLATRSAPDRYTKGTVWVAVTGSAWAQELRMRKEMLLSRLRNHSDDPNLFTDMRFGVRPLPVVEPDVVEEPEEKSEGELSIREIARRRLAKMRGEAP